MYIETLYITNFLNQQKMEFRQTLNYASNNFQIKTLRFSKIIKQKFFKKIQQFFFRIQRILWFFSFQTIFLHEIAENKDSKN